MKKIILPLLAAAGLAAFVTGCSSTPEHGAYLPENTTKFTQEIAANFVAMDPGAAHSVTSPGIQPRVLDDGRLEVAAMVRNRENRRIQVQIQCEFKDEQGVAVDSTPWETLILTENGIETKRFTSLNAQAKKYTVRVREAR
ncbi:MAG TPA: YcfL family protein [Verrucomicrobiae bacterium]|jgi:uncharacterized protein YcfL